MKKILIIAAATVVIAALLALEFVALPYAIMYFFNSFFAPLIKTNVRMNYIDALISVFLFNIITTSLFKKPAKK